MKKLPLGIQRFREIITEGYVYADKTEYIYNLINNAKYYFLSRPRRFGKSLLLDTIAEVFSGDRELFKGLWIYDSNYCFTQYPVVRLDMSNIANETPQMLKNALSEELMKRIKDEKIDIASESPGGLFKGLIEELHKKYHKTVVVLIDEYDSPILAHISNLDVAEANREVLRDFYGILKSMPLKLTFITGVSKFAKTSIFSGLNNLLDITFTKNYVNICGINIEDLDRYFGDHIAYLSTLEDLKHITNLHDEILTWYDGYSWDGKTRVINPYSLLSFFHQERFESFWYETGTPKFLIDLIKKKPGSYTRLKTTEITERMLGSADLSKLAPESVMFQTGYLTVKERIVKSGVPSYILDIPNFEVKDAFNMQVLAGFTENDDVETHQARIQITTALETGDLQQMLYTLRGLFASIPYQIHVNCEAYYHSIFYCLMRVLGVDMDVEVSVSTGRVDAVVEVDDKVYIFEFKYQNCEPEASDEEKQKLFNAALTNAMNQIKDRGYAKKYTGSGKRIYQVAFAFLGRDNIEMLVDLQ
jgi:hypothetical protein